MGFQLFATRLRFVRFKFPFQKGKQYSKKTKISYVGRLFRRHSEINLSNQLVTWLYKQNKNAQVFQTRFSLLKCWRENLSNYRKFYEKYSNKMMNLYSNFKTAGCQEIYTWNRKIWSFHFAISTTLHQTSIYGKDYTLISFEIIEYLHVFRLPPNPCLKSPEYNTIPFWKYCLIRQRVFMCIDTASDALSAGGICIHAIILPICAMKSIQIAWSSTIPVTSLTLDVNACRSGEVCYRWLLWQIAPRKNRKTSDKVSK